MSCVVDDSALDAASIEPARNHDLLTLDAFESCRYCLSMLIRYQHGSVPLCTEQAKANCYAQGPCIQRYDQHTFLACIRVAFSSDMPIAVKQLQARCRKCNLEAETGCSSKQWGWVTVLT